MNSAWIQHVTFNMAEVLKYKGITIILESYNHMVYTLISWCHHVHPGVHASFSHDDTFDCNIYI